MNGLLDILAQVILPIWSLVAVGFALQKLELVEAKTMTNLALYCALPALVLESFASYDMAAESLLRPALAALLLMTLVGLVTMLVCRVSGLPKRGMLLATVFINCGALGLSLVDFQWGRTALPFALVFYTTVLMAAHTLGAGIAKGGSAGWLAVLRLPVPYAIALSLVLASTKTAIPQAVGRPLHLLASLAIPLMLLSLGTALARLRLGSLRAGLWATLLRVGGGFLVALLVVALLDMRGQQRQLVIVLATLPTPVTSYILASRFGTDTELVATSVFLSTTLTIVTTPLVFWWLGLM